MELNNYLTLFPRSSNANNMAPGELNDILLHVVPNIWEKQSYLQVCYFEWNLYKDACGMFECMEIVEQVYKGGSPSKTTNLRAYSSRASHGRKRKDIEANPYNISENSCAGNFKKKYAGHPSDQGNI